jgi:uncharacterized protein (TIGR00369 family)
MSFSMLAVPGPFDPASEMRSPEPRRPSFTPANPDYAARVRSSFDRQGAMRLIGARLAELQPGYCAIELPYRNELTQQHGYIHAGIVSAIADSAGGYAGFTLFPADASVLTVEYKLNLLAPAKGERLIAEAEVVKPGRTLVITRGEVHAEVGGKRSLCAVMQQTLIVLSGKTDG